MPNGVSHVCRDLEINMSGIVGSKLNHRGSGIVGSLGSDGQVLTSSGAGTSAVFEAAPGFGVGDITGATALAEEPAVTDEIVISDGGTLKRLDLEHMMGVPLIMLEAPTGQTITGNTAHIMTWDTVTKQVGGTWANDSRWTPGVEGHYWCMVRTRFPSDANASNRTSGTHFVLNGDVIYYPGIQGMGWDGGMQPGMTTAQSIDPFKSQLLFMDADDYMEIRIVHNGAGVSFTTDTGYSQWLMYRARGSATGHTNTSGGATYGYR